MGRMPSHSDKNGGGVMKKIGLIPLDRDAFNSQYGIRG